MIAEHYSAPAATAVRILIKREADRIQTAGEIEAYERKVYEAARRAPKKRTKR